MKAYIQLLCPLNCVMVTIAVFIGALIAKGFDVIEVHHLEVIIVCIVAFLFTGAGNSLNDYFDRIIDKVNHPTRPIPSGRIKPNNAMTFSAVLFVASLILAIFINLIAFIVVIANFAVMLSYDVLFKAKGIAGNFTISWLTATTFLFGGAALMAVEKRIF